LFLLQKIIFTSIHVYTIKHTYNNNNNNNNNNNDSFQLNNELTAAMKLLRTERKRNFKATMPDLLTVA
jgi:hypothetical protein